MNYELRKNKFKIVFIAILFFGFFGMAHNSEAADHYVREGATGLNNGTDWTNAYTSLPAALFRGDTYYIADGSYGSYTFDDAVSGEQYIAIKKATIADHGTDVGWSNTYGDGQAIFAAPISFTTSYYIFDGNGTHTIPSNNTNDYGFKVNNTSTSQAGVIRMGPNAGGNSNIIVRYTHIYSSYGPTDNPAVVAVRWPVSGAMTYSKLQNCFIENSGQDGLQMSASDYILVERCYLKRLGRRDSGTPNLHGQAVQMFVGNTDVVFRYNVWEACEGQSLIAYGEGAYATLRLRFYGNVVFTGYGQNNTAGFGLSGGIIGNAWTESPQSDRIIIYNNTIVNQRQSYTTSIGTATHYPSRIPMTNSYIYNNIHYNSEASTADNFNGHGYHASGGYGTAGGTNEQTGLSSSIFTNYTGDDFRLASATTAGITLSSQSWWQDGPDSFFGQLDYNTDMYGNIRGSDGTWDRGAFEYVSAAGDTTPPTVSLTDLASGSTVSGSITVSADASDDVGVAGVQFKLDGATLGSEDTTSPYSISWNTATASNGSHTLTATARDAAGNQTTSAGITVTVSNASPSTITIGETNILSTTDSGNGNLMVAQSASLSQPATVQSLSFYITTAAGKLRLGIYDSTGPSGGPGQKKAETNEITPVVGWNTANVITPVLLQPGTYWLAYLPESGSLGFRNAGSGSGKWYSYTYGVMPQTFSTSPSGGTYHWSLYATLNLQTDTTPPSAPTGLAVN